MAKPIVVLVANSKLELDYLFKSITEIIIIKLNVIPIIDNIKNQLKLLHKMP